MKYNYKVEIEKRIYAPAGMSNNTTSGAYKVVKETEQVVTQVPVMKGDLIKGLPVVAINHVPGETVLRVIGYKE